MEDPNNETSFEASLLMLNSMGTYWAVIFSQDFGGVKETEYEELVEIEIELNNGGNSEYELEVLRTGAVSAILIFLEFDSSHRGGNLTVTLDEDYSSAMNLLRFSLNPNRRAACLLLLRRGSILRK